MAQAKAQQQAQDEYAQQGKKLASSVQRLRGWVGSDPSRAPELADALIQLTAHRLLGHGYAAGGGGRSGFRTPRRRDVGLARPDWAVHLR